MMKNNVKKVMAAVLAMAMVVGVFTPVNAQAASKIWLKPDGTYQVLEGEKISKDTIIDVDTVEAVKESQKAESVDKKDDMTKAKPLACKIYNADGKEVKAKKGVFALTKGSYTTYWKPAAEIDGAFKIKYNWHTSGQVGKAKKGWIQATITPETGAAISQKISVKVDGKINMKYVEETDNGYKIKLTIE